MKIKILYDVFSLPAVIFHELSHFIMILLLGVKFKGIIMNITADEDGVNYNCCVYHKINYKIQSILISLAPSIFWLVGYLLSLFMHQLLFALYLLIFLKTFNCSEGDIVNMVARIKNDKGISINDENLRSKIEKTKKLTQDED